MSALMRARQCLGPPRQGASDQGDGQRRRLRRGVGSSRESRACISSWAAKHPRPQHASKAGAVHAAAPLVQECGPHPLPGSPRDRGPRLSGRVQRCRPHAVQYWAIQQIRSLTGTPCTEPGLHCRRVCVTPLVGGILRNPSLSLSCAPLEVSLAGGQNLRTNIPVYLENEASWEKRSVLCSVFGLTLVCTPKPEFKSLAGVRQAVMGPTASGNNRYAGPSLERPCTAKDREGCRNGL